MCEQSKATTYGLHNIATKHDEILKYWMLWKWCTKHNNNNNHENKN